MHWGCPHGDPGTLNHWISPGGTKQHWRTSGALPGCVLAQTFCLCLGMCHTPITLPPLNLPQSICSALSQVVSSPYLLARQMRNSGSVQSVPSFPVLGRGNFSLMTQGKSRTCISGALIPLAPCFSLYIWLILCQETWLLACTSLFWGFCIPPLRPCVPLLSSKG